MDIYYSINGVNIGEAGFNSMDWVLLRAGTNPLGGVTKEITKVTVPGYDGYFQAPSTRTEQVLVLNIQSPRENVEALMAVLSHVGYDTAFPTFGVLSVNAATDQAAYFELVSALPSSTFPSDEKVTVTATLNIPYGGWRDTETTETTASITTNPTTVSVASGISLPVRDMDVFIQGNVGTMQISDSAGSWLRTTGDYVYASGNGIFYQGSTGRAFKATTASPWVATADLGFAVDVSGGGFKMTPKFNPAVPNTRAAELTVLSTLLTDVSLTIRWRGAYVLR